MTTLLLLIQSISENIALFCCAMFAGGSVYISLVEDPVAGERGPELAGVYLLTAHPRPAVFQAVFGALAALAGMFTAGSGGSIWWAVGGLLLAVAALAHSLVALPEMRKLRGIDITADPLAAADVFTRLTRLHAGISLASLAALLIFILHA